MTNMPSLAADQQTGLGMFFLLLARFVLVAACLFNVWPLFAGPSQEERLPCCLLTRNLPTDHFFLLTSKIFCHFRPQCPIFLAGPSHFQDRNENAVQPFKSFLRWIRYSTGGAIIIIHFFFFSSSNLTWQARLLCLSVFLWFLFNIQYIGQPVQEHISCKNNSL